MTLFFSALLKAERKSSRKVCFIGVKTVEKAEADSEKQKSMNAIENQPLLFETAEMF